MTSLYVVKIGKVPLTQELESHMKRILSAAFLCVFAASLAGAAHKSCKPAVHAKVPALKNATYHAARKKLLLAGWKPLRTKALHATETDADIEEGNGPLFWKKGYVELESCSGTGLAFCSFLFRDAYGNRLRVVTGGEELPEEKAYALVDEVYFVCGKL
jgi:hypothetical protein